MRNRLGWTCIFWAYLLVGCAGPRMVSVDQTGGVVAIPENSNAWPNYYRTKAEDLIKLKCPEGYEIVREEEVTVGQRMHTNAHTEHHDTPTVLVGGAEGHTTRKGDRTSSSDSFGGIAIPVGPARQITHETTSYQDVTEWRIYFRKK